MSSTVVPPQKIVGLTRGRLRAARALLAVAAAGAGASAAGAVFAVARADAATKVVETWRLYGFIVFAGLFILLALRPLHYRGVWELIILNKLALTVTAIGYAAHGEIGDANGMIGWDGALTAVLAAAYILARGWAAGPRRNRGGSGTAR